MAEKEYIEREAASRVLCDACGNAACPKGLIPRCSYYEKMQSIPAADVRPVVRGRWIHTTQPMGWRDEDCAECSVCGEDFVLDEWAMEDFTNLMNFCPNCGADMREGN